MRVAVLFLFIASFAFGEVLWRPNQEYIYGIYTRTLTALPDLKEQYVGVITKGELVVQVLSPNRVIGKLVNCVYANFHDILENGVDTEIPENKLNYQPLEFNNKPFAIEVDNGFIKSIYVDQSWTNDQVNQLKGILSQLQVDVAGKHLIHSKQNQLPRFEGRPHGLYKVMEPTVTGMCETIYDVNPIQRFQLGQMLPRWTHFKNIESVVYPGQKQQFPGQTYYQPHYPESGENYQAYRQTQQEQFNKPTSTWQHLPYGQPQYYGQEQQSQQQSWGSRPQFSSQERSMEFEQPQYTAQGEQSQGNYFEIVKTINYNNCIHRKGYHYGIKGKSNVMPFGNKVGDFMSRSTITKIIAYGNWNNFIVQNVITNNRISVSPDLYQQQKAKVVSQIQLKLLETHAAKANIEEPKQVVNVGNLVYTYNLSSDKMNRIRPQDIQYESEMQSRWANENVQGRFPQYRSSEEQEEFTSSEEIRQRPVEYWGYKRNQTKLNMQMPPEIPFYHYTVGNRGCGIQVDSKINLESEVWKLVNEIAQDVLVQDEIPKRNALEKFDILCDLIRSMNQQQILSVHKQLGAQTETEQNIITLVQRKVFRDAVAHAGTGPAVSAVCKWIANRQVKGIEARDLIEDTCKNLHTPTAEIIRAIFSLVKNDQVRKHKQLYSYVLLCLTNLLRHAQVNKVYERNRFPVYVFGNFHTELEQVVVSEVIPYLEQCLQESLNARDDQYTLLYLRALGNVAHPEILNVYERCMESGAKLTQFQRTALVLSLDKLCRIHPDLARTILFKIFANVAEAPETRSVAVLLLMRCKPSVQMLQRLAECTHNDPSEAVRSVVKSAITTCSELRSGKWKDICDKCKSVRKFLTPRVFGDLYSKTYFRDYVGREMNLIYYHQLTHIIGEDNVIPKITEFKAFESLGGFRTRIAEMQAMVSTVEELIKLLPNCKKGFCQKPTTYYRQPEQEQEQYRSPQQTAYQQQQQQPGGFQWLPRNIREQLNVEPEVAKRLEGQLLFNFLGRKGFYTFDEKVLKELPQTLTTIFGLFKEGENLNYNKMYLRQQVVIAYPLATGYPFIYTFRQPQLLQAIGQIQIKTYPDIAQQPSLETIQNIEAFTVNANIHLVYSTNQIGKTGFITPFNRQRYVAGHVRKVHSHIPLNLKLDINLRTRSINLKVTPIDTKKDFYLLQSGAWPFTLRKDAFDLRPAAECKDLKVIQTRQPQMYDRVLGEKTTGMVFQLQCEHQFKGQHQVEVEKALWKQGVISLLNVPLSYHDLFQKLMQNEGQSLMSFLPFAFQPRTNGNFLNHVIWNLLSLPLADELNVNDYLKNEGYTTFLTLPFADKQTLEESLKSESILTLGGWPWPLKSLDHYKYNLKYDAARSVNHIIKLSLKLDAAHNVNEMFGSVSNRVQGPVTMDEEKLAYAAVPTPDNEQRRTQFLQNAASQMKQASVAVLDAAVVFDGQNKVEYVATVAHGESPVDEKDRLLIFLSANEIKKSENKQMCISYVGKFPKTPTLNFERALQYNPVSNVSVRVAYGDSCQTAKTRVLVNMNLEQSPEYKQMVKYSKVGQRCLNEMKEGNKQLGGCIDATYQANLLDTVTINFDMQNPTQYINDCVHGFLNVIRKVAAWNLEHEIVNKNIDLNKIVAVLKFKPIMNNEDRRFDGDTIGMDNVDIMLNSGDVTQVFTNVHINKILRPMISVHPTLTTVDRLIRNSAENRHICTIDQSKIFTFDNKVVNHQIGKCWHAMVLYTKLQSRLGKLDLNDEIVRQRDVSILVRQAPNVNQKELMIVCRSSAGTKHMVHLIPTSSAIQVKIDGQDQTISPNQCYNVFDEQQDKVKQRPLICVRKLLGNEIKVQIRGKQMKIYYDGVSIRVHTDPALYRKNLQGLCGAYTGEKGRDLVTRQQCVCNDHMLFTSSWAIDSETCPAEVKQAKLRINQMRCDRVRYTTANIFRNWNIGQKMTPRYQYGSRMNFGENMPEYQSQEMHGQQAKYQWGKQSSSEEEYGQNKWPTYKKSQYQWDGPMSGERKWSGEQLTSGEQQRYGQSKFPQQRKSEYQWSGPMSGERKWSSEQLTSGEQQRYGQSKFPQQRKSEYQWSGPMSGERKWSSEQLTSGEQQRYGQSKFPQQRKSEYQWSGPMSGERKWSGEQFTSGEQKYGYKKFPQQYQSTFGEHKFASGERKQYGGQISGERFTSGEQQYGQSKFPQYQSTFGEHKFASGERKQYGSSSQEQSFENVKQSKCVMKYKTRYYEEAGQICFSKTAVNTCPSECVGAQKKELNIDVYCRDMNDPVTKLWIQQIKKGENPDLSIKTPTKTMKISVPQICVH